MLTSVDLKRKAILVFTGVNLAVNLALSAQHWSVVERERERERERDREREREREMLASG